MTVDFINKNFTNKEWGGNVCEIGSGNGKLLFRLADLGIILTGHGIEVSKSRHKLSERYKKLSLSNVITFHNSNILDVETFEELDLIIGLDTIFQLVTPIGKIAEKTLVGWIYNSLKKGGHVMLDFRDLNQDYGKYIKINGNNAASV